MSFDGRRLTDPRDFRALSHPLRLRLLELLDEGPLTATEAATALGTTPANCSFHLRLLARHGFVTEAPAGPGRQRPWRLVHQDLTVDGRELGEEGRLAVETMAGVMDERKRERVAEWRRTKHDFPAEWQRASTEAFLATHLTAAELAELTASLHEVLRPYLHRTTAERPTDAVPVDIFLTAIPRRPPEESQ